MAYTINRNDSAARSVRSPAKKGMRLPGAIALAAGSIGVLVLSFLQVARVSPRQDVKGLVQELRKTGSQTTAALPEGAQPLRGTRLWAKKTANH